jgi:hypothetical protein
LTGDGLLDLLKVLFIIIDLKFINHIHKVHILEFKSRLKVLYSVLIVSSLDVVNLRVIDKEEGACQDHIEGKRGRSELEEPLWCHFSLNALEINLKSD